MESGQQRWLSIGEFAAATQLTPKALRLYDEQEILRPATADPVSGYRYYRSDQVPLGRLVRALRDMNLSLSQISRVLDAKQPQQELLLRQFQQEAQLRHARELRAHHAALLIMRRGRSTPSLVVEEIERGEQLFSVWPFTSDLLGFAGRYVATLAQSQRRLAELKISATGDALCSLIDPLTNDEGQLELWIPLHAAQEPIPVGITMRRVPRRRYATVVPASSTNSLDCTAAIDALFDWFDRHGRHAVGSPLLSLHNRDQGTAARVLWAFDSVRSAEENQDAQ